MRVNRSQTRFVAFADGETDTTPKKGSVIIMNCEKKTMLLYAVTDRSWAVRQTFYEQVEAALAGGVTCVQLREKAIKEDEFLKEAIEVKSLCSRFGVPLIINDNVKVAASSKADGIHVGQKDMNASDVRTVLGDNAIIGVSARTVEQALRAEADGADYLGVGAVFTTSTKLDTSHVTYEALKEICQSVSIPVVAIGGITKGNIAQLSGLGVDGIAVVSAIFSADDIEKECRELRELSEHMVSERI